MNIQHILLTTALCGMALTGVAQERRAGHPHGRPDHHAPTQVIDTTNVTTLTRDKGAYIINTTRIGYDFRGFRGPTPLEVCIQKNRIVSVTALPNNETPKYFEPVKTQLLPKFEGRKVTDVQAAEVDAVTGATFSSEAVKENVRRALEYYKKNK